MNKEQNDKMIFLLKEKKKFLKEMIQLCDDKNRGYVMPFKKVDLVVELEQLNSYLDKQQIKADLINVLKEKKRLLEEVVKLCTGIREKYDTHTDVNHNSIVDDDGNLIFELDRLFSETDPYREASLVDFIKHIDQAFEDTNLT
jgi:hypothetical protein